MVTRGVFTACGAVASCLLTLCGAERERPPPLRTTLSARTLDPTVLRQLGAGANVAAGDRIVLPRSALEALRKRGVPVRGFRVYNTRDPERQFFTEAVPTSCPEGMVCAPAFLLQSLGVADGDSVGVESAHLPRAESARFQAHSSRLAEHPEMEAMLTSMLEGFAALTTGTTIELRDGPEVYKVDVIAVRGRADRRADSSKGKAVWIDNIDLITDWAPPKDARRRRKGKGATATSGAEAQEEPPLAEAVPDAPGPGGSAAPEDAHAGLITVDSFDARGLTPLGAVSSLVAEDIRCEPLVQMLLLDARIAVYVARRAQRLAVNAVRWALALQLLPPVGVAAKDQRKFAHPDPEPSELLRLRLRWLAHVARCVALFALGMPASEPFPWPDAVKERTYSGRYGFLGGWTAPWLEGWPYKGVFASPLTGDAGKRRWRQHALPTDGHGDD